MAQSQPATNIDHGAVQVVATLKVEGMPGESLLKGHENEIDVLDWAWGAVHPASMTGGGLSSGKVEIKEFRITKFVDKASANLIKALCSGKHIAKVVFSACKNTGASTVQDFLKITLTDAVVTRYATGLNVMPHDPGALANQFYYNELVSFACTNIDYDYKLQNKDGTLSSAGTASHNARLREAA